MIPRRKSLYWPFGAMQAYIEEGFMLETSLWLKQAIKAEIDLRCERSKIIGVHMDSPNYN